MTERLQVSAWPDFAELYKENFTDQVPTCTDAIVVVEREEGKIVGFGVLRQYTVLESFWVTPQLRRGGVLIRLINAVLTEVPNLQCCFAFTSSVRLMRLFEHLGMELLKCSVMRWVRR